MKGQKEKKKKHKEIQSNQLGFMKTVLRNVLANLED